MKTLEEFIVKFGGYLGSDMAVLLDTRDRVLGIVRCQTLEDGTRDHSVVNALRLAYSAGITMSALVKLIALVATGDKEPRVLASLMQDASKLHDRINTEIPTTIEPSSNETGYPNPEPARGTQIE